MGGIWWPLVNGCPSQMVDFFLLEDCVGETLDTENPRKCICFRHAKVLSDLFRFFLFVQTKKKIIQGPSNKDLPIFFCIPRMVVLLFFPDSFGPSQNKRSSSGPSNKVTAQTVSKLSSKRAKCKAKLRSSVPKPLERARWRGERWAVKGNGGERNGGEPWWRVKHAEKSWEVILKVWKQITVKVVFVKDEENVVGCFHANVFCQRDIGDHCSAGMISWWMEPKVLGS